MTTYDVTETLKTSLRRRRSGVSASKFRFHKSNESPRLISRGDDSVSEIVALLCVAIVEDILLCLY